MSLEKEIDLLLLNAKEQISKLEKQSILEQNLLRNMPQKFEENLEAFSRYLPDVAKEFRNYKVSDLKLFCSASGDLNIIDNKTGGSLYGDCPITQCHEQVNRQIEKPKFTKLSFSQSDKEVNPFIHTKYLKKMHQCFLDAKNKLKPLSTAPDHIGSAIIFGIGLGYHLKPLLEKITIDHLYIVEPNRDFFFASLYTCDWKYILEEIDKRDGNIVLNLGVSYQQFTKDFWDEMKHRGAVNAVNSLLYQHYPSEELTKLIGQFEKEFHLLATGWGFFDDGVISIAHEMENRRKSIPLLRKSAYFPKQWEGLPIFIIANGPSLDECIDTIKAYKDKAIIMSCGSALPSLLKQNIVPDFHVALERTKATYDFLTEFCDLESLKKINFLTLSIMHPSCPDLFKWTGMALKNAEPSTTITSEYIDNGESLAQLKYCNPQVANTGVAFACYMGFKELYLFGVDGGYKDPKKHHSKHSVYYKEDGKEKETLGEYVRTGELVVEGNFGGEIISPVFYNTGIVYIESCLKAFKKVACYNCSDGVKIKSAFPTRHYDLLLADKTPSKNDVINYIKNEVFIDKTFDEEEYVKWIAYKSFNNIVDNLVNYIDKDFSSRSEMVEALKQQSRYIYSYSQTRYRHIYFLLEGSMTYLQSMFRMMLYTFEDEQESLVLAKQGVELFKEYMDKVKEKFKNVTLEVDEFEYSILQMFRDEFESEGKN